MHSPTKSTFTSIIATKLYYTTGCDAFREHSRMQVMHFMHLKPPTRRASEDVPRLRVGLVSVQSVGPLGPFSSRCFTEQNYCIVGKEFQTISLRSRPPPCCPNLTLNPPHPKMPPPALCLSELRKLSLDDALMVNRRTYAVSTSMTVGAIWTAIGV